MAAPGPTATATVSGGQVTGITITNGGTGYTSNPGIIFSGGGSPSVVATANVLTGPTAGTLSGTTAITVNQGGWPTRC